jgi:hypothetical protein
MEFKQYLQEEFPITKLKRVRELGNMSGHRLAFLCKHPHKARSGELLAFHQALNVSLSTLIEQWGVARENLSAIEREFFLKIDSHDEKKFEFEFEQRHSRGLPARA